MKLFDDIATEPTPGQINRLDAQRRAWRIRQRKSRAARKLAARVAAAACQVATQNEVALARRDAFDDKPRTDAQWIDFLRATNTTWGSLLLNRHLAARVFERLRPEDLMPPHDLIFDAARRLHERGAPITRPALEAELRRSGIILLHGMKWLDRALDPHLVPRFIQLEDIDNSARILREA